MKHRISLFGCGWLGEPLAIQLIRNGYQVKGSTTTAGKLQRLESLGIVPFLLNLESISTDISRFLESDILIVAVASKNVDGFRNLLAQIEKSPIQKILFISSTSVYENSDDIITEQATLKSSGLCEIEELFRSNASFLTTVLRLAGLFGYNRNPANFFPPGKPIGNPNGSVNMIHQDDCIRIISQLIENEIWGETFNACADTHPTRREFYTKAALDIGRDAPVFIENGSLEQKIISNQKLKTVLGFQFSYPDLLNIKEKLLE